MSDVCEDCWQRRREQYWNVFPPNKHHFFKLMLGENFMNQLRIPRKFIKNFKGELLEMVTLKGPSGNSWETELVRTKDDSIFEKGWATFARDHNLQSGYFLLFTYDKNSTFDVLILDTTGCEVENCYFVERKRSKYANCCLKQDSEQQSAKDHIISVSSVESKESEEEVQGISLPKSKRAKKDPGTNSGTLNNDEKLCSYPMYYLSKRRTITRKDKKRAYNLASKHSSMQPSSKMIRMKPSHVCHGFTLTIPREFAKNNLFNESQEIQLRVPPGTKTWEVQLNLRKQQQYTLTKGWPEFVLDNYLEVHDYCVLELAKKGTEKRKAILNVYIFRAVEEVVHPEVVKRSGPKC